MLKLKNNQLVDVVEFLENIQLKPKASRVRTKLNKLLGEKVEELYKDEMELLQQFGKKDETGQLLVHDGAYSLVEETALEYHQEKATMLEEVVSVNVDELKEKLTLLIEDLENLDVSFSGKEATTLDVLLELLETEIDD